MYQNLALPYSTPFVGLFLSPSCYLRLLADFKRLTTCSLHFQRASNEPWINRMREAQAHLWPIGCLGGEVEIQFMHYRSEPEAQEKWRRRCARLTAQPEKLFFKFDDRDGCSRGQMQVFDGLPLENKVFLTTREEKAAKCAVRIPLAQPCVPDGLELSRISPRYFDAADWLLGGTGRPKVLLRWLNCI